MAKKSLDSLLAEIITNVEKTSADYRNFKSNRLVHGISVDAVDVAKETEAEFKALLGIEKLERDLESFITEQSITFTKKLYDIFKSNEDFDPKGRKWVEVADFTGGPTNFSFSIVHKEGKNSSIFNAFKKVKQEQQKDFNKNLAMRLKVENKAAHEKWSNTKGGRGFLDIGHEGGSSVSAQRLAAMTGTIADFAVSTGDSAALDKHLAKEVQEALDSIEWTIQRSDEGPPIDKVKVKMESKQINRDNKDEVLRLNKAITKIIDQLAVEFAYTPGSDSSITKRQKLILKEYSSVLKGKKGIKLTGFDSKLKKSYTRPIDKKAKAGKAAMAASLGSKGSKRSVRRKAKESVSMQSLKLIVAINKQLPDTVAKNMGKEGRLVYRSGRFAGTPRVTDIIQTPRGFPSIGYTYQTRPYDTFEMGGAQGTPDRDPRKLIDTSIREIAAQFTLGRFYTRRV